MKLAINVRLVPRLGVKESVRLLMTHFYFMVCNALNAEIIAICHLLALLGAHYVLHVSRVRVKPSATVTDTAHKEEVFNS